VSCAAWLHFRHSYTYSRKLKRQNVQAGDMSVKDDNDCDVVEVQTNPIELDSWDPFQRGGVIAPEGFT
jgi:hypothetical protein